MLSRSRRRSSGGLAALVLLLLVFFDVPADAAAAVVAGTKRRGSSISSENSLSSSPRSRRPIVITSIGKLRSLVTPSASYLPGCVLFLTATSAAAAGCSSKPRRLRQDPPPTLPLVGGLPKERGENARQEVIAVLGAGDDAAALDLLVHEQRNSSSSLSSRGVAGLVALPGPPPEGDWSPDDANPQVRGRGREIT